MRDARLQSITLHAKLALSSWRQLGLSVNAHNLFFFSKITFWVNHLWWFVIWWVAKLSESTFSTCPSLSDDRQMPSHAAFETRDITTDSWLMRCVNDLPALEIPGFINSIRRVTTSDHKWLHDLQGQQLLYCCGCCCHVTLNCGCTVRDSPHLSFWGNHFQTRILLFKT